MADTFFEKFTRCVKLCGLFFSWLFSSHADWLDRITWLCSTSLAESMSVRIKTGLFCLIELLRCMQLDLMRLKFRFYWRVHWSTNYNTPSPPRPLSPSQYVWVWCRTLAGFAYLFFVQKLPIIYLLLLFCLHWSPLIFKIISRCSCLLFMLGATSNFSGFCWINLPRNLILHWTDILYLSFTKFQRFLLEEGFDFH